MFGFTIIRTEKLRKIKDLNTSLRNDVDSLLNRLSDATAKNALNKNKEEKSDEV